MALPFEAAKSAVEKVLMVRFPLLTRVLLPGLLGTAVLYPVIGWVLRQLPTGTEMAWQILAAYAALVLVLGAFVSTLSGETYKIYEGRILWPAPLLRWALGRQQSRVEKLLRAANTATITQEKYNEIWYQLRLYPVNEHGAPYATHPTLLGNILSGYEQYPANRYGMDSVFYWPRIWLQVEKDKKEEIDSQWSVADGFLTLSAISNLGGALWGLSSIALALGLVPAAMIPTGSSAAALAGAAGWLVLAYGWYRLSLPFHRENGEVFKSIFDVYRTKVWDVTSLRPEEREIWRATWLYLQYLRLPCPNCGNLNFINVEQCQYCGFELAQFLKNFRASGKFPL